MNNYLSTPTLEQLNLAYIKLIKQLIASVTFSINLNIYQLLNEPEPTQAYSILQKINSPTHTYTSVNGHYDPYPMGGIRKVHSSEDRNQTDNYNSYKIQPFKVNLKVDGTESLSKNNKNGGESIELEKKVSPKTIINGLASIFRSNQLKIEKYESSQNIKINADYLNCKY